MLSGVGIAAFRSCRGQGKAAAKAKKEARAIKKAFSKGLVSHRLQDGVLFAPFESSTRLICSPILNSESRAQRVAAFEDAASRMSIPVSLDTLFVAMMDGPIILNLGTQLGNLMSRLDELDMARDWPAKGDALLWQAHGVIHVAQVVFTRSPEFVTPALAMQAMTLRCCLRSLLQQRQAIREANNAAVEIVEIDEEDVLSMTSPISPVSASSPAVALDRSVSDASSCGTPGGSSPMSARGSVVEPFGAVTIQKPNGKSPLGEVTRQGYSAANSLEGSEPAATTARPLPRRRRKRKSKNNSQSAELEDGYKYVDTTTATPPPPPPPSSRPRAPSPVPAATAPAAPSHAVSAPDAPAPVDAFKQMLWDAQVSSVGGDEAKLKAQIADRRAGGEAVGAECAEKGQATFDAAAAERYFLQREQELLAEEEDEQQQAVALPSPIPEPTVASTPSSPATAPTPAVEEEEFSSAFATATEEQLAEGKAKGAMLLSSLLASVPVATPATAPTLAVVEEEEFSSAFETATEEQLAEGKAKGAMLLSSLLASVPATATAPAPANRMKPFKLNPLAKEFTFGGSS